MTLHVRIEMSDRIQCHRPYHNPMLQCLQLISDLGLVRQYWHTFFFKYNKFKTGVVNQGGY